jgi:hypothetical protein
LIKTSEADEREKAFGRGGPWPVLDKVILALVRTIPFGFNVMAHIFKSLLEELALV